VQEEGYDGEHVYIRIDPKYFRLSEVELLCGDYSKAKDILGWEPSVPLDDLIREMVEMEK
jgi:GDPmannose 4,6-dehydratase